MSKFFYHNRKNTKSANSDFSGKNNRVIKPGTAENPLNLVVTSEARQQEVELVLTEHGFYGQIAVDDKGAEDISELDGLLNKPKTTVFAKTPNRNDPCSCESGKKYKKCCGQ